MPQPQPMIFYDWPYSPFCMKVRAILDYKGLDYLAVNPLGQIKQIALRGGIGKVPAIELDGEFIADSTDIAYALERCFPAKALMPDSVHERGLVHSIEEWADESLYFVGLYYRWYEREGRKPIAPVFGRSLRGKLAYRFYLRRILGQLRGQGTLRKPPDHVARDLDRHLDAVEALLNPGPFVLGSRPYLCDFALWGQLVYLDRTPVGGAAIAKRPAIGEFLKRVPSTNS
jgi:glutathione S-transferase